MKATLLRIARIVVSVALMAFVLSLVDIRDLGTRLKDAHLVWIFAAFAVNSIGNVFGAWRWKLLLRSQGRSVSTPYLYGSYLVGLFFNNFLPSSIGGDFLRATAAKKKGGGTLTENLTVVLVERMIGLLATLTLGGIAALTGEASRIDPRITWALGAALVAAVGGLYLALNAGFRDLTMRLVRKIPIQFVGRTVGKMLAAFELFSQARGALIANYAISIAFQFLLIVHFYLIQFAFGESVPFLTFVVVVPLVFFLMLLPIGINGFGVREGAFVWFLTRAGMDPETALALSLVSYGVAVLQGVLGGLVHLWRETGGRSSAPTSTDPRETETAETEALETERTSTDS